MKKTLKIVGMILVMITEFGYTKNPTYYGIVIGCCEEYQNKGMRGLNAKADANSFYNKLVNMYYGGNYNRASKNLHLLTEKSVTRYNVKNKLKSVAKNAQSGDVLYFFYSGHGSSLEDKSKLIAPSYRNNELIKVMENSGLIVPYTFNLNKVGKTAIIAKRDLRDNNGYGFEYLDNKGVQVIMISDSCFSGNMFRSSSHSTLKFVSTTKLNLNYDAEVAKIRQHAKKRKQQKEYKNLIFFSAGGTDKAVAEDNRLKRGKFSLVVEKCLKNANQNRDNIITKKEFQECLHHEDSAKAFVVYPPNNKHANKPIFRSNHKKIPMNKKDKIRVKTSISNLAQISNEIVIDNQNYDIEIIKAGNQYQIFRYTGEEYANVDKAHLSIYLNALKLFKLKGQAKLTVAILNEKNRKEQGKFCYGEKLSAEIKEPVDGNIVALTLDNQGTVIMLQPDDSKKASSKLIDMLVKAPEGMDKLKVFTLSNQNQYNKIKNLVFKDGVLTEYGINKLYNILKSNKNYKEAEVDIETIDKPLSYCKQGD